MSASASMRHLPSFMACVSALFVLLQVSANAARDDAIVADLSEDRIGISTRFTGATVLLFGATEGRGDVVVVVRSPDSSVIVRRKERVAGIWVNADDLTFDDAPGFYHVASSGPLPDILLDDVLKDHEIGVENIEFKPHDFLSAKEETSFREALIRNKQRSGLYSRSPGEVTFQGDRLFRTRVALPSNVPTGNYRVSVHLVERQQIVATSTTDLSIEKVGFEAKVTEFAFEQAPIYGAIAILVALIAGWFAGFVFRKV